jgi:decaprenylphospho-beta-D-erythro-pentofuranosid-2-ulose 2-reductase
MNKKIVIVGATSRMAEHCARIWAISQPKEFVLIGRDFKSLDSLSADLKVRTPNTQVKCLAIDLLDPLVVKASVNEICTEGPPDLVLIAHGSLPDQKACESDISVAATAFAINGTSPLYWAESFAFKMITNDHGHLAIIGSVAGDRGRKSNYVYGAAKGFVSRYVEGMQHRLAGSNVKVTLIKPGPTDTPMTAHLKKQGAKLASVETVAEQIVKGVASGKPTIYVPGKWYLIMTIIRHLPRFIFNKMDI